MDTVLDVFVWILSLDSNDKTRRDFSGELVLLG